MLTLDPELDGCHQVHEPIDSHLMTANVKSHRYVTMMNEPSVKIEQQLAPFHSVYCETFRCRNTELLSWRRVQRLA